MINLNRGGHAMSTRFCRATLALTLAIGMSCCFVAAVPAQAQKKMTLVQMHPNMGIGEEVFLYAVPKRLGYFAAEGLDVDIQNSQTGMISAQVLQSSNAQVVQGFHTVSHDGCRDDRFFGHGDVRRSR